MRLLLAAYKTHVIPYYQSFFVKGYFVTVALLLATIIYVNYYQGFPRFSAPLYSFAFDYCLYALPFAGSYFLQCFFYSDKAAFSQKWFLVLLFTAPAFFALKVNTQIFQEGSNTGIAGSQFVVSSLNYLVRAALLILLACMVWLFWDKQEMPLYGFTKTRGNHIYALMFLLMLPVLLLAAGKESFAGVYPKSIFEAGLTPQNSILQHLFFELCYGFDFLSIEFFFRGFLIFAFARYVGMRAIVPAACFYCCIHLGKPMAEAISSFFGGFLLGIISYNTKSIWGGLFIHLGIAWMMELFTWLIHHS